MKFSEREIEFRLLKKECKDISSECSDIVSQCLVMFTSCMDSVYSFVWTSLCPLLLSTRVRVICNIPMHPYFTLHLITVMSDDSTRLLLSLTISLMYT